ncbi:hypothetical protein D3C75_1032110 [compost metagenome]
MALPIAKNQRARERHKGQVGHALMLVARPDKMEPQSHKDKLMQDYKFRLTPFQNMHFSEEETEARFSACVEDARNGFEEATVTLENDVLCISVKSKDDLSEDECLKRFKDILINGNLSLFAQPLF